MSTFAFYILRIEELVSKHNKTVLMVTHDPLVAAHAHMVLHLEKGAQLEGAESRQNVTAGGGA